MIYYCKKCKHQILSLEGNIDSIICPKCKSKSISIGEQFLPDESKNLLVNNRSKVMSKHANDYGLPIVNKGSFGYLDYDAYSKMLGIIDTLYDSSKYKMFKSIKKIKIINSKTNFVEVAHDDSFYLSIGSASLASSREVLRLIPTSPKLVECYSQLKAFLFKQIKFDFNQNNFIKLFLEKINEYVIGILPDNNENRVNKFIADRYSKRRNLNVERLITPKLEARGFIIDIDEFIDYGLGVCRHRNLLNAYLIGKLFFEIFSTPSQNLQLRYSIPINRISKLKSIFNIRSKVYQPRGDIIARNKSKIDVVGAHTWCAVMLHNMEKTYSGIYIVDGMWEKVYNFQDPKDAQKAMQPSSLGGYTYDVNNIKRLIDTYQEQNLKYYNNKKQNYEMSLIEENVVKEEYYLHEKPINWDNKLWKTDMSLVLKPFLETPLLKHHELNIFNQLLILIDYNDFFNTYIHFKNFHAYIKTCHADEAAYENISHISQICIEIMEKHM